MTEEKDVPINEIKESSADLKPKLKPGMSDGQVLDIILGTGADEIIPWEDVVLPSLGAYYKDAEGKDAVPGGKVQCRAMGIYADKVLANARLHHNFKSLDWLFRKCVKFPEGAKGFDPIDLLNGDRMFLLYYLRGITHGPEYEFMAKCSNTDCGIASPYDYDLNDLVRTKIGPNPEIGPEPFKVSLPYLSEVAGQDIWVKVRLLRGRDVTAMLMRRSTPSRIRPQPVRPKSDPRVVEETEQSISLDDTVSQNLSLVIIEAMGDKSRSKIDALVEKMHSRDTATIREYLRVNSPGIEFQVTLTCPRCETEMTMDLPITESFFRPRESGGPR